MFFIDRTYFAKRRDFLLLHILPTVVVFLAFISVTIAGWANAQDNIRQEAARVLGQKNEDTAAFINERMGMYEGVLRGGTGLFNATDMITREQWRTYLEPYNITSRYPGIQGVGFARVITPDGLDTHQQRVRAEGYPNYSVFPAGDRPLYTSIVYIEPFSGANLKAFGYDMYSEPTRRAAMEKARDSGHATVSDQVALIQEEANKPTQPGFLMYYPLYNGGVTPQTIEERRAQIKGYLYAPFRAYDLMDLTAEQRGSSYAFEIHNHNDKNKPYQTFYASSNHSDMANITDKELGAKSVELPGTSWEIHGIVSPDIVNKELRSRPSTLLWGGFIFSFFVAGFIYLLLTNRTRALAEKEENELQHVKDELLALASHQLRTPATGVKQYIGMLKEGLAGSVTPEQQKLLDKAYESNERQLGTINEMLFVARADAGQLNIERQKLNISEVVREIVDEQRLIFVDHSQELKTSIPKRNLFVYGDKQYLRMALENVITNASKYTRDGGHINISLKSKGNSVIFTITDDGVGVAQKDQPMLFKKFSRIPNELTSQVSGSGIGLYLAKHVIDKHEGSITFESAKGDGSTVTITLPNFRSASPQS